MSTHYRPKRRRAWPALLLLATLLGLGISESGVGQPGSPNPAAARATPEELSSRLQEIYSLRAGMLLTGADAAKLEKLYATGTRAGRWALEHERNKIAYLQTWAQHRGVRISEYKVRVRIDWLRSRGEAVQLGVTQSLQLGYRYPGEEPGVANRFGIGTRHWVELVPGDGTWLIGREWYVDPLGDDTLVYRPTPAEGPALPAGVDPSPPPPAGPREGARYNRLGAVAYAEKYAGAAQGEGSNGGYNRRYRDYNDIGGDCTNFISQVIGDDREGGGLPQDGTWYYRGAGSAGGAGSTAWVQTEAFARWLRRSGAARHVARGRFADVALPGAQFPRGAVRELRVGDIIGYEEKGEIQHFAVITAHDSRGYPLVNAHTADRFHSPWDLGWDQSTVFWLYQIVD